MARLGGLGRGLDALIPAAGAEPQLSDLPRSTDGPGPGSGATHQPEDSAHGQSSEAGAAADVLHLLQLPISALSPNPNQPRVHFDEDALAELAASISAVGVLQPVLVRATGDGSYQIVAGERRWRAARRAGLDQIPALVRSTDDLGTIEQALVENFHRQDLTPLEEAAAFQQLIEDFGLTHDAVASRVGKSRSSITNTLRLLTLPPSIQHLLADGRLSAGHARALLGCPQRAVQEDLARRAVAESLSVRAIEDRIRDPLSTRGNDATPDPSRPAATPRPRAGTASLGAATDRARTTALRAPGVLELEHLMSEHLSTRVEVAMGASKGRITIDFADLDDLERLYRRMSERNEEPPHEL